MHLHVLTRHLNIYTIFTTLKLQEVRCNLWNLALSGRKMLLLVNYRGTFWQFCFTLWFLSTVLWITDPGIKGLTIVFILRDQKRTKLILASEKAVCWRTKGRSILKEVTTKPSLWSYKLTYFLWFHIDPHVWRLQSLTFSHTVFFFLLFVSVEFIQIPCAWHSEWILYMTSYAPQLHHFFSLVEARKIYWGIKGAGSHFPESNSFLFWKHATATC